MSEDELLARIDALEARVRELEDDREIRDLLAKYGYTADNCDDEGFVDLYTDDGEIRMALTPEAAASSFGGGRSEVVFAGKDGVRTFITLPEGHHSPALYGVSMHLHGTNLTTYVDGDDAVANSYHLALATADGETTVVSAANNRWRFRRVDGRWRIRERRSATLGDAPFATNLDFDDD